MDGKGRVDVCVCVRKWGEKGGTWVGVMESEGVGQVRAKRRGVSGKASGMGKPGPHFGFMGSVTTKPRSMFRALVRGPRGSGWVWVWVKGVELAAS